MSFQQSWIISFIKPTMLIMGSLVYLHCIACNRSHASYHRIRRVPPRFAIYLIDSVCYT